ncbi:MAG: hypothetical protein AAB657_01935 [Patescibacteria group bacterium]
MFDSNSSSKESVPSVAPKEASSEAWGDIHVMPQASASNSSVQAPTMSNYASGINKKWLIISGIILGVLIIIGGGYWWWSSRVPTDNQQPITNNNQPVNTPPVNEPPVEPEPQVLPVEERDRTRFRDIKNIQTALDLYFSDLKKYPISVLPIVLGLPPTVVLSAAGFTPLEQKQGAEYLAVVPKNIEPGGTGYLYESSDGTTYTITFTLEQGVSNLLAGEHKASPKGFDTEVLVPPVEPRGLTLPTTTIDTDADGLTDAEEIILGTDKDKTDSDSDTYSDGLEVDNDYDPALPESKRLTVSSKISNYQSERFNYSIIYPSSWLAKPKDTEGSEVIFSGAGDEFIEVLVIDNPEHLSATDWYIKQLSGVTADQIPTIQVESATWVLSFDGLNAYFANDQYIFTLAYNAGTSTEVSYYKLFRAMLRSFKLVVTVQ